MDSGLHRAGLFAAGITVFACGARVEGAATEGAGAPRCPGDCDDESCQLERVGDVAGHFMREGPVRLVAYRDGFLYLTAEGGRTLARVPECGGALQVLARTEGAVFSVAIVDGFVYWARTGGRLLRTDADGGSTEEILQVDTGNAPVLGAGAHRLFVATASEEAGLFALDPATLATSPLGDASYWNTRAIRVVEGDIVLERLAAERELVRLDPTTQEVEVVLTEANGSFASFQDAAEDGLLVSRRVEGGSSEELLLFPWAGGDGQRVAAARHFGVAHFTDRSVVYAASSPAGDESVLEEVVFDVDREISSVAEPLLENPGTVLAADDRLFVAKEGALYRRRFVSEAPDPK